MSKPPSNPFSGGERTVIVRPNPGGRRDVPLTPPQHQSPPADDIWNTGEPMHRAFQAAPPPTPAPPPPPRPASARSVTAAELGLANPPDVTDANPVLKAARPLMVLLASLRLSSDHSSVVPMMDEIANAIIRFERELGSVNLTPEQIKTARYAICATADDIVQNLPGSDRLYWTQYSMLSRFFGATTSGVGFFEELNRARAHPTLNYDLLELMHACLSLGFQGQFRSSSGGDVALQQVRRDLYQTLRTFRPAAPEDLSPHWKGQDLKPEYMRVRIPVWAVATATAVLLLGIFIALRILLGGSSEAAAEKLLNLHPDGEVQLARTRYEPLKPDTVASPDSTQLLRIRAKLTDDIAARRLAVEGIKNNIVVRLLNDVAFDAGRAEIKPSFHDVLERVAATLDQEPKNISIIGHTDATPLKSKLRFKDNQDLSEQRAKAVAQLMAPKLADAARLETLGRGSDQPIASNKTGPGRAANRRVEILLPRTGP